MRSKNVLNNGKLHFRILPQGMYFVNNKVFILLNNLCKIKYKHNSKSNQSFDIWQTKQLFS